jgi:protein-L-isoaspartate(D-aspartate) O-methyltransferase
MRGKAVAAVGLLLVLLAGGILAFDRLRSSGASEGADAKRLQGQRLSMVRDQIVARGVRDRRVLAAMRAVPRHEFVSRGDVDKAYEDHPLPIGFGQTISQPYIVALMTELAAVRPGEKVLEIGTGSGYQAAVLAELTDRVDSVEIIPELARSAAQRLRRLGYRRVAVKNADGYFGWAAHAPYDAIIVTAAPDHVPPPLIRQLKEGGRLVIPVGPPGSYQTLWRIVKIQGEPLARNVTGVIFVPLVRGSR